MQTKPTPTEGQNSTKLEAESALRDAACSPSWFPSWIADGRIISTRPRYTPIGKEFRDAAWVELDEKGFKWAGGAFLSLIGHREAQVNADFQAGRLAKWEYIPYNPFRVLWDLVRYGHPVRWRRVYPENVPVVTIATPTPEA
jgi:hypothetical protein